MTKDLRFGSKPSTADKMKVAERYKPAKPTKDIQKPKVSVRPTGSLKKPGVKVTAKW